MISYKKERSNGRHAGVISSIPIYSIVQSEPQPFNRNDAFFSRDISMSFERIAERSSSYKRFRSPLPLRSFFESRHPVSSAPSHGPFPKGLAYHDALISTCSHDTSGCKREAARGKWLNGANLVSSVDTDSKRSPMSFWHDVIIFPRRVERANTSVSWSPADRKSAESDSEKEFPFTAYEISKFYIYMDAD